MEVKTISQEIEYIMDSDTLSQQNCCSQISSVNIGCQENREFSNLGDKKSGDTFQDDPLIPNNSHYHQSPTEFLDDERDYEDRVIYSENESEAPGTVE